MYMYMYTSVCTGIKDLHFSFLSASSESWRLLGSEWDIRTCSDKGTCTLTMKCTGFQCTCTCTCMCVHMCNAHITCTRTCGILCASGFSLQLKEPIVITGVTLEHIPKELTPNGSLSSAPKDFRIVVSLMYMYM